jgi:tRNA pseudouridine55 synthase
LDGFLLLDKRSGISSNQALQEVRRLFNAAKAGHTGSLDPLATGLLPICFGQATRLSAFLLDTSKAYQVDIRLGRTTTTGDTEGEILEQKPVPVLDESALKPVLSALTGSISQVPPMYSALKQNGVRLYELARKGIEVERKPRTITIYDLEFLACSGDLLSLRVSCSKGTYIRTLAESIGEAIGCGAHIDSLRRTGVGQFRIENSWTVQGLETIVSEDRESVCLLPIDQAVGEWPRLELSAESAWSASLGQSVLAPEKSVQGWVRMYTPDSHFLGMGEVLPGNRIAPRKLFLRSTGAGQ